MRNTTAQLRKDIETIQEALAASRKEKPVWFRLDEDDLTDEERIIVDGASKMWHEAFERTQRENNCNGTDIFNDIHNGKHPIKYTEDEMAVLEARYVIFQRKAVPPLEYARRHPIH